MLIGQSDTHLKFSRSFYVNLFNLFGFVQLVDEVTHRSGHILDLVCCKMEDSSIISDVYVSSMLSDHMSVHFNLQYRKAIAVKQMATYRRYRSINKEQLSQDIEASNIVDHSFQYIDDMVCSYNNTIRAIIDNHAPLKTKIISIRKKVPWFDDKLTEVKRNRRKLERIWKSTRLPDDQLCKRRRWK